MGAKSESIVVEGDNVGWVDDVDVDVDVDVDGGMNIVCSKYSNMRKISDCGVRVLSSVFIIFSFE